jgi:predicted DNA-binding transcriptional regulator AlpA
MPLVARAQIDLSRTTRQEASMKVLSQRDLPVKGITWSREHTRRMWEAGKFPRPFKLATKGWNYWNEDEVDRWLEERASRRTRQTAVTGVTAEVV